MPPRVRQRRYVDPGPDDSYCASCLTAILGGTDNATLGHILDHWQLLPLRCQAEGATMLRKPLRALVGKRHERGRFDSVAAKPCFLSLYGY